MKKLSDKQKAENKNIRAIARSVVLGEAHSALACADQLRSEQRATHNEVLSLRSLINVLESKLNIAIQGNINLMTRVEACESADLAPGLDQILSLMKDQIHGLRNEVRSRGNESVDDQSATALREVLRQLTNIRNGE